MGRPLRIQSPGGCYHVFNRGSRRQETFVDDADRSLFLDLLARCHGRYGIEIHAYCLMDNHYHLLVRTPEPKLAKAMQYVIGSYTRRFNLRHGLDGSLFRGRYKAKAVESDRSLLAVSRYIHLNPLEAGLVSLLGSYRHSSYPVYEGRVSRPRWLFTELTLGLAGGAASYVALVEGSGDSTSAPAVPQRAPDALQSIDV